MVLTPQVKYAVHIVVFILWIAAFEVVCGGVPFMVEIPDFDPYERSVPGVHRSLVHTVEIDAGDRGLQIWPVRLPFALRTASDVATRAAAVRLQHLGITALQRLRRKGQAQSGATTSASCLLSSSHPRRLPGSCQGELGA